MFRQFFSLVKQFLALFKQFSEMFKQIVGLFNFKIAKFSTLQRPGHGALPLAVLNNFTASESKQKGKVWTRSRRVKLIADRVANSTTPRTKFLFSQCFCNERKISRFFGERQGPSRSRRSYAIFEVIQKFSHTIPWILLEKISSSYFVMCALPCLWKLKRLAILKLNNIFNTFQIILILVKNEKLCSKTHHTTQIQRLAIRYFNHLSHFLSFCLNIEILFKHFV